MLVYVIISRVTMINQMECSILILKEPICFKCVLRCPIELLVRDMKTIFRITWEATWLGQNKYQHYEKTYSKFDYKKEYNNVT